LAEQHRHRNRHAPAKPTQPQHFRLSDALVGFVYRLFTELELGKPACQTYHIMAAAR
jgi:hypothetical protein